MNYLKQANESLRLKNYEAAIEHYVRALQQPTALPQVIQSSLKIAQSRYLTIRQDAKTRVCVSAWSLSHNAAGRASTLAQLYQSLADVQIIGCHFKKWGVETWAPLRNIPISIHGIVVQDETQFVNQALELVLNNPCDLLHLSKPRFPNIIIGLLYKLIWGSKVVVDIDDEELSFVSATEALAPDPAHLPNLADLTGKEWTRIAVGLANAFDGTTVVNPALQKKYGGTIVRHARDESVFKPSVKRRQESRSKLGIKPEQKVVLFLGTPRAHKGLLETAQAIAQLKREDVLFLVVGEFPVALQAHQQKIEALLGSRARFFGDQPFETIPDILAAGDICVLLQDQDSLAAHFQTPAKLSDALAMGLTVLAEPTPALVDLADAGAFQPVKRDTLAATLAKVLDQLSANPSPHPVYAEKLSLAANHPVLQTLLNQTVSSPLSNPLQQLASSKQFSGVFRALIGQQKSALTLSQPVTKSPSLTLPPENAETETYIQLAGKAMSVDDWAGAYRCWQTLFERKGSKLNTEMLLRISRELFKLDAFTDAAEALSQAAEKTPNHPSVLCEQAAQYYYHCYSSWLMLVTENEPDWYKADGLDKRPDWQTACDLIEKAEKAAPRNNLRRYVQAYLLLAEEAWDKQQRTEAHAALRIALNAIGPNKLDKALTEAIFQAVDQFRHGKVDGKDPYYQTLQDQLKALPLELLPVPDWLCLNDILNWNGLLLCGYVARENAVDLALAQGMAYPNNKDIRKTALKAALDRNDTAQADNFLAMLKQISPDTLDVRELDSCCELMRGNLEAFRKKWPHPPTPAQQRFREYLKGKTVAVVGPAPTGSLNGAEIDSFDFVVRVNWRIPVSSNGGEFGNKCDGSLYNAHTLRLFIENASSGPLNRFSYHVLLRRPNCFIEKANQISGLGLVLFREWPGSFNKSLNAIPYVLFNLLLCGVEKIKIFKSTNYVGETLYNAGYKVRGDAESKDFAFKSGLIRSVMANHDLLINNSFMRPMVSNVAEIVDFDSMALKVVNCTSSEYAKKVQYYVSPKIDIITPAPSSVYHHLRHPQIKRRLDSIKKISTENYDDAIRMMRRQAFVRSKAYNDLSRLKNIHEGKRCFIIGNGPSLKEQDLSHLKDEITFVTNWFVNADSYHEIEPKYYCISSHEMFGGWNKSDPHLNDDFYGTMQQKAKASTKFFSYNFSDYVSDNGLFPGESVFYLLFERPKFLVDEISRFNLDLSRHLDDAYTVVLTMCVPLAIHMGIKEIYFIGCDCDYGISAPDDKKKYFYDSSLHKTTTTNFENLQRIWSDNGPVFKAYDLVRKAASNVGVEMFNATHGGKLETLPRVEYPRLFTPVKSLKKQEPNIAFCTVLNDDFVPGFLVTLHSLKKNNPEFTYDYYVFYSAKYSPLSLNNIGLIRRIYERVIFKEINESDYFHIWTETKERLKTPARLRPAFFILEAFSLIDYDRVIALDADLLILGDLRELFSVEAGFAACQAVDYDKGIGMEFFNSGVMVINPPVLSKDTYKNLLSHNISKNYKTSFGKADQAILNDFFLLANIELLDVRFNTTKRKYRDDIISSIADIECDNVLVLHYVGDKPWVKDKTKSQEYLYTKCEYLWLQCYKELTSQLLFMVCHFESKFD